MQSLDSSVLAIDYNKLLEADHVSNLNSAAEILSHKSYDVIILNTAKIPVQDLSLNVFPKNSLASVILLHSNPNNLEALWESCAQLNVVQLIDHQNLYEIKQGVISAIEIAQKRRQEKVLESMVQELNAQLKKSLQDLEERVEKRQAFLLEARKKTFIAQTKWELTKQTLIAIQQGISLPSIEQGLMDSLKYSFDLKAARIVLHPLIVPNRIGFSSIRVPLVKNQEILGTAVFYRDEGRPFSKDESDFLNKLSEALSMSVERLKKLEQTLSLREQWQTTFNAVADPIVLINEKYQIVQANNAFESKQQEGIKKTCYETLFSRTQPCEGCKLGSSFRIANPSEKVTIWDVVSQRTASDPDYGTTFINLYHEVTAQVELERKIVESAKLAEIGTIGGSIAHELNNPLAGILSLVQLIKMDLKNSDDRYKDISEMEQGVFRCRDIIENLLNFARDPSYDQITEFNLIDTVSRAIKILELQTKSKGIEIKLNTSTEEFLYKGRFNLLSEAFRNILQNSIESVVQKLALDGKFRGKILVGFQKTESHFEISITDNGLGAVSSSTLSQSIANQIIHEHQGSIRFNKLSPEGISAIISIPRPVF
jgi:nitrogen-specific signal transduction histidine kinase